MTDERREPIRRHLDNGLVADAFEADPRPIADAAASFFQTLFVQTLDFEPTTPRDGDHSWHVLSLSEVPPPATTVRLVAKTGRFRVVYVELDSLTSTAERQVIQHLARSDLTDDWGAEGTFLAVFHTPSEHVWHLVTPYERDTDDITSGRVTLRRFTLGEGVTHGSVADALATIEAGESDAEAQIHEAFDLNRVVEAFYSDYKRAAEALQDELRGEGLSDAAAHRYAHVTLTRLLALSYLEAEGWFGDKTDFVRWFYDRYRATKSSGTFHDTWLSALLFDGLQRPAGTPIDADVPPDVASVLAELPETNLAIFSPTDCDERDVTFADSVLDPIICELLEGYTFTVSEERPYVADVAVDPSMLGKMYESLIAEQERGEAGVFYTPNTEVDLMCRMALYEQCRLGVDTLDETSDRDLVEFVFCDPMQWDDQHELETDTLVETLRDVRVVDPACGSGAFLVGMTQVVEELSQKLGRPFDAERRRQVVEQNLYGVDIKDWAVNVAEFRLWLSVVAGGRDSSPTRTGPKLSFNLYTGDSMVEDAGFPADSGHEDAPAGSDDGCRRFLWHRDFASVMDAGGFDVVLTNPPYVDHQHIVQQQVAPGRLDSMDGETVRRLKSTYKDELVSYVRERFDIEPYRRSDLYLYFVFRAIDVLRDGGTLACITSSTWLDNSYGKRLQQGLLEFTDLGLVVDNRTRRSFASANVNTVITVANKAGARILGGDVGFVALGEGYERVVSPTVMRSLLVGPPDQESGDEFVVDSGRGRSHQFGDHRVVRLDEETLWRIGGGTVSPPQGPRADAVSTSVSSAPGGTYTGNTWGQFLRAPSTYFELLDAGRDVFTPLSEIASVESYLNTGGADDFFFVDVVEGDPETDHYVTIQNRSEGEEFTVESEFVVPFVESPRQVTRIDLSKTAYSTYLLRIPKGTDLSETKVREYVEWGERPERAYHTSSGRRKVDEWWVLGPKSETNTSVVWPNRQNARHFVAYNPDQTVTHRFYRLHPHDDVAATPEELAALLNFSPTALFTEVLASAGLGQGVLDVTGTTLRRVPVVDPGVLSAECRTAVLDAFRELSAREMGTLYDELGAQTADDVTVEMVVADRRQLDRALFESCLGLERPAQKAVYEAILRTVTDRLDKSRSV
ncbi:class I SAM-dependent DNA methyltransferase [Haloferax sp. YSMS24]|uniref:HsdM family class I SAM-dependent methyltransferase n=1 Tax=Haloferax sp. YSMS24 TaxID=3388425 RepID=UPI00398CFCDE